MGEWCSGMKEGRMEYWNDGRMRFGRKRLSMYHYSRAFCYLNLMEEEE